MRADEEDATLAMGRQIQARTLSGRVRVDRSTRTAESWRPCARGVKPEKSTIFPQRFGERNEDTL